MSAIENQQTAEKTFSPGIIFILAAACGLIVANLYYAQPLIGLISEDLGLSSGAAGLIVTLAQIGYGLGLLFLVPLGDILETRKLVVILLVLAGIVLAIGGVVHQAALFLGVSMLIGVSSVAAQVLVPYAAHLSPEATRGRNVGNVMSGLLLGIMLARPVSSLIAEYMGWRAVYFLSAGAILVLALVLARALPTRKPTAAVSFSSPAAPLALRLADGRTRRAAGRRPCGSASRCRRWLWYITRRRESAKLKRPRRSAAAAGRWFRLLPGNG